MQLKVLLGALLVGGGFAVTTPVSAATSTGQIAFVAGPTVPSTPDGGTGANQPTIQPNYPAALPQTSGTGRVWVYQLVGWSLILVTTVGLYRRKEGAHETT